MIWKVKGGLVFVLKILDLSRFEFDFEILSSDPNRGERDKHSDVNFVF